MTPRNSDYPMSPGQTHRHGGLSNAKLLAISGVVLFAVIGFIVTETTTARQLDNAARAEIVRDVASNKQRIAVLEEAHRNNQQFMTRIEAVLEDIRRQLQSERRR